MPAYRDANGHFISEDEARRRGLIQDVEPKEDSVDSEAVVVEASTITVPAFGAGARAQGSVFVDTGRGQGVEVPVGSPFVPTLERLAEEAHYGGYFRIFLNGNEVVNPTDSPQTIEPGMRITITSYDKVG